MGFDPGWQPTGRPVSKRGCLITLLIMFALSIYVVWALFTYGNL
jgi:hypothetical protein